MIPSRYDWHLQEEKDVVNELIESTSLDQLSAKLLANRQIKDKDQVDSFLHPDLSRAYDPFLLNGMDKAVDRIQRAIEDGESILIYGDYDADGMTSASIIKETLEDLGGQCQVYLPNRFTDGYGPNESVYRYFIEQEDITLIITVDNGVSGFDAIEYANTKNVDVIITDHHSLPEKLPNAYAIIHPECSPDYPFKELAGCGVAFKLSTALLGDMQAEFLDLVAIGTIADMMSLTDENRLFVSYGLQVLQKTQRIGLQELLKLAKVDFDSIDEETIGFAIAPRLNALGRLDDPNPAIELLTGFDDEDCLAIAQMIDNKNNERKNLVQSIYEEAKAMINLDHKVQVLAHANWHPGVLGIVAGRIMESIHQPVIILSIEDGLAKGSARSVPSVDIFEALDQHRDIFEAFGGHSGAAGMTLLEDRLPDLQAVLEKYILDKEIDLSQKSVLKIDDQLDLTQISLDTVKQITKLAPFGMGNRKPVFRIVDFTIIGSKIMGKDNSHLKLQIEKDGAQIDLLAFNMGEFQEEFSQAQNLELAVTLSVNRWNGNTSVQLMLLDAKVDGIQLIDIRKKNQPVPHGVPLFSKTTLPVTNLQELVVDCVPGDLHSLKSLLQTNDLQTIYFKNTIDKAYYLTGFGRREQYARLYKTLYRYPEFDLRHKLGQLSQYLKIPQLLLIKMIQIFEELGFVSIRDGVMTVIKESEKRAISESQIYQELKEIVAIQELFALGTPQDIYQFIMEC